MNLIRNKKYINKCEHLITMAKVVRSISLDHSVYEWAKNYFGSGNLSKEVEAYLKALMGKNFAKTELKDNSALIKDLEGQLAQARIEKEKFDFEKQKVIHEQLVSGAKLDIQDIRPVWLRKVNEASRIDAMVFEQKKKYLMEKYGLMGISIMAFCDGSLSLEQIVSEIDFSKSKAMSFKFEHPYEKRKAEKQKTIEETGTGNELSPETELIEDQAQIY